ncbi:MAG: Wzz/FepE/Etk N-terminal domain-containing protein, partial [Clostridiales bacterium]|nr:Wzz/FepE/Etk N-terminal domain-containing protein [Clostridiales bacterium]
MEKEEKLKEIDLMDYWRVIVRRKWVAITFAGAIVLFTGIFSFLATPQYKSTATLLIEEESSRILNIDETLGYEPRVVQDLRAYNTQLRLLKSKSLAERVARKLNLLSRPEFGAGKKPKTSLMAGLKYIITLRWISSRKNQEEEGGLLAPESPYSILAEGLR